MAIILDGTNGLTYTGGTASNVSLSIPQSVGIGTAAPLAALDVRGSSSLLINANNPTAWVSSDATLTTQSMYLQVNTSANDTRIGSYTNHALGLYTNNTARITIDTAGNVGIGTSSPLTKLDVSGTSRIRTDVSSATVISTFTNAAANTYATYRMDANDYQFYTTGSSKVVIDSSGNVGIGLSPGYKLDVNGGITSRLSFGNSLTANIICSAPSSAQGQLAGIAFMPTFVGTGDNGARRAADIWAGFNAGNWGTQYLAFGVGNAVNDVGAATPERMRIDTSGNVGINTSVMNVYDAVAVNRPLVVARSDTSTSNIGSAASLTISNLDTTTNNVSQINFAAITGANTNHFSSAIISAIHGARVNGQYPTGILTFSTSTATNNAPSEKVRINAAGQLLVGGTASIWDEKLSVLLGTTTNPGLGIYSSSGVYGTGTFSNSGNALIMLQTETAAGTGWRFLTGRATGGGLQIQIFGNGSIQNALNSYGSTSDIKIKENIVDASNKLSDLLKVRVVNYNLIDDTNKTKQIGVIAQELESIFPGLVEYNPADDLKSVKYSVFVPILIKAIQEQQDIITRLTARIESLENK